MVVWWGAAFNITDQGDFAATNSRADSPEEPTLSERSQYVIPVAGTIERFLYNTQTGNATTTWKIIVNAATVATIVQTAAAGLEVVSVAVAQGDLIAIEYDTGDTPNRAIVGVYIV